MEASVALVIVLLAGIFLTWLLRWLGERGRLPANAWRDGAAIGALGLAVIGFFWRVVSGQAFMPADGGDLGSFLYPMYHFAARELRSGHLPWWNPHLYGGSPFIADPQSGVFYPLNLAAFLILPQITYRVMEGLSLFHFWWMGIGTYFFLRDLTRPRPLSRWAALAGALAMTFCDPMLVHFGNLNLIAVASWLPWTLWAFHRGQEATERAWRWTLVAGGFLGVGALAGHPQMTLFTLLALAIEGLLLLLVSSPQWERPQRRDSLLRIIGAGAVGILIVTPIWLLSWGLSQQAGRVAWDYTKTVAYSLSPAQWIGWIVPGFFGRGPQLHWSPWERVEIGYLGIFPLILAALAVSVRRDRLTWRLLGLALASLLIASGIYALPHGWLTALAPGMAQLRAPARFLFVADLALAGLAALGIDLSLREGHWRAHTVRRGALALVTALGVLALGLYLALALRAGDAANSLPIAIALISVMLSLGWTLATLGWLAAARDRLARPAVLGWLAAAIVLLDLGSGAYNDLSDRPPTAGFDHPEIVAFLRAQPGPFRIDARTGIEGLWQPSAALLHGLDDVWGVVNPLVLSDYEKYWEGLGGRSTRLYDFLNVGYVIARKDVELDWGKFELAFDGDPALNVYRNRAVLPRAFVVYEALTVADHEQAWAAIHAPAFDPARQVVIEGAAPFASPLRPPTPASWQAAGPNRVRITVDLEVPGYLVISQPWYAGWQARLANGERLPVLRANYAFQAVALPTGHQEVTLTFRPRLW